jgi:hypothetical protein
MARPEQIRAALAPAAAIRDGQKAPLGPQGRVPSSLIRFMGSIFRTAAMTCHFPAHRRRGPLQTFGDITNRRTGSEPS